MQGLVLFRSSVEFPPHQHPAESEKRQDPGGGDAQAVPDTGGLGEVPTSQHHVPHPLHGLGVRQQSGERLHPLARHPFQWPDEATE